MEASVTIGQAYLPLLTSLRRQDHKIIFLDGQRGTGKTRGILSCILLLALQYPGTRWALWRSSRTRLTDTVLYTLETQVFPAFGIAVPGAAGAVNRSHYNLANGSSLIPVGLDDIYRSTSAEFAGGYLNEGIEISTQREVESLIGSLRQEGCDVNQLFIDANPGPPNHWLNRKAEDVPADVRALPKIKADYDQIQAWNRKPAKDPVNRWKRIICGWEDNPGYWDADRWCWRPKGENYVQGLSGLSGAMRRQWYGREWCMAEGSVFPMFDERVHVVDDFEPPADWPWFIGWDPGFAHKAGIPWITIAPNDDIYVGDEIYEAGCSVQELVEKIRGRKGRRMVRQQWGDPHEFFSNRAQGKSLNSQVKALGMKSFNPWANQPKQAMVAVLADLLMNTVRSREGTRKIYVMRRCMGVIAEFQSWEFKKNAKGELLNGDDAYVDANNDLMDPIIGMVNMQSLRYGSVGGITVG